MCSLLDWGFDVGRPEHYNTAMNTKLILLALACLLAPAIPVWAQEADTPPASPPNATELAADEKERLLLSDVHDQTSQLDELGFYVLLHKAFNVASENKNYTLDSPSIENLLSQPETYRGQPISLKLRVYRITPLAVGSDLTPTPYLPEGCLVWQMDCGDASIPDPAQTPVTVFTPVRPARLLLKENAQEFPEGRPLTADGFFYKVRRHYDLQGTERNYPILVAWAVTTPHQKIKQDFSPQTILLLVVMGGLYVMARYSVLRKKPQQQAETMSRIMDGLEGVKPYPEEDTEVDPDLVDAARKHKKEQERSE
jgi:hypothetical protein